MVQKSGPNAVCRDADEEGRDVDGKEESQLDATITTY